MRGTPQVTVSCDGWPDRCTALLYVPSHDVDAEMEKAGWSTGWDAKDYCRQCGLRRDWLAE